MTFSGAGPVVHDRFCNWLGNSSQETRMKKLVLAALLAAVASSTACVASSTDARVTASWSFNTYANKDNAPTEPCPANYPTATVHSKEWDPFLGEFVPGGLEV